MEEKNKVAKTIEFWFHCSDAELKMIVEILGREK